VTVKISDILRYKGSDVVTIAPDAPVRQVLARLAEHNVGALVVLRGEEVAGIVSERDIVRRLNETGAELLDHSVDTIMTVSVLTTQPDASVDSVAQTMTEERIRHLPVVDNGRLAGVISVGDVVSSRIRQLEQDRGQLEHYITG
jgi:CBS domain-containing protein